MPRSILVTGGAGFIGSHTVLTLLENNYHVVVIDSFINSSPEGLNRVKCLSKDKGANLFVYNFDLKDINDEGNIHKLQSHLPFDACIHFSGLKAVGESVREPLRYYKNNIGTTLELLDYLERINCCKIVFSSSATVYGTKVESPISESMETGNNILNPYGRSKFFIEEILKDWKTSCDHKKVVAKIIVLRYFNPIGNHSSGTIGEDPNGVPNNLMPYISQVAIGKLPKLSIYGNKYDTPDGTGIRDYLHVSDLAEAHVAAIEKIDSLDQNESFIDFFNIGTGKGYSVMEILKSMEDACGKVIPFEITDARAGDSAISFADATKANHKLNWTAKFGLSTMCQDVWKWQQQNPKGYKE